MSFLTHTSENVLWMSSSLLDGSGVRHGFSTRIGGVSPAPWDSLNLGVGRGDDTGPGPGKLPPVLRRPGGG